VVLALYVYGLTTNVAVGVMVRVTAGVSVKVATRTDTMADTKAAARNKLIMLIVMWGIS
jgi:hypothetical protein